MSDGDDGDELVQAADGVDEFIDKARVRSLFQARDEAADAVRRARIREHELGKTRPADEARRIINESVRANVAAYVLEAEPLLKNTSTGLNYWQSYEVGPIRLPRRCPANVEWEGRPSRTVHDVPDGLLDEGRTTIAVPGIRHFVRLPSPLTVEWSGLVQSAGLNRGTGAEQKTVDVAMPRRVSEDVFRAINKLLADLGIGLDAEAIEDGEASYDYSDLL